MRHLTGKVAFVTGGVTGLGLGIARVLVDAGMKVVITYKRSTHKEEALSFFRASSHQVHAIELDVSDRSQVVAAADEAERVFGRIHLLCNNAGVNAFGPMDEATFEDWDWILSVNLGGVVNTLVTFIPRMKRHLEGGHIVNVASLGALKSSAKCGIYTTSKFAVRGLSESLRQTLAPHGIGVSVFCPGLIRSKIYESSINRPAHLARSGLTATSDDLERWRHQVEKWGMDPLQAGRAVLRGIRENAPYIFTPTRAKTAIREQFDQMMAAIPERSEATAEFQELRDRRPDMRRARRTPRTAE